MPHERFFTPHPFEEGSSLFLTGEELHHLKTVMRLHEGELIELVNGKDVLAQGRIVKFHKQEAEIQILSCETTAEKKPYIILAQALPRFAKLEIIIEKGTELGAHAFWLFPGMYSEKETLSENQMRRVDLLLQGALKQCGRLSLPKVELKPPLLEWQPITGSLFFGDLEGEKLSFSSLEKTETRIIFIGPEKGWAEKEKKHLLSVLKAKPILLGPYTLRADTAALSALSFFAYQNT